MDWSKIKEKILERIVIAGLSLVAFLCLVIWQAVPSQSWEQLGAVIPKKALAALIALLLIVLGGTVAFIVSLKRQLKRASVPVPPDPGPPQYLKMFSMYWDDDLNPLCPADQTMLVFFMRHPSGGYDILQCARCGTRFQIHHDSFGNLTLAQAKSYVHVLLRDA